MVWLYVLVATCVYYLYVLILDLVLCNSCRYSSYVLDVSNKLYVLVV